MFKSVLNLQSFCSWRVANFAQDYVLESNTVKIGFAALFKSTQLGIVGINRYYLGQTDSYCLGQFVHEKLPTWTR